MNPRIKFTDFIQKFFSKGKPKIKAGRISPTIPLDQENKNIRISEPLNCDRVFALLDKYVEMDLEGLDVEQKFPEVRQHLQTCENCCKEYQTLISVYKKLKH